MIRQNPPALPELPHLGFLLRGNVPVTVTSPRGLRNRTWHGTRGARPHGHGGLGRGLGAPRAHQGRVPIPPAPQHSMTSTASSQDALTHHQHPSKQTGAHPIPAKPPPPPFPNFWGCRELLPGLEGSVLRRKSGRGAGRRQQPEFPGVCTSPAQRYIKAAAAAAQALNPGAAFRKGPPPPPQSCAPATPT